jgi:hypothetical protein
MYDLTYTNKKLKRKDEHWVTYKLWHKEQTVVSHISGGWEVKSQGASTFTV